jgi:hypothetical protein
LRTGAGEQSLREHGIRFDDQRMQREIAVSHQSADAHAAVLQRLACARAEAV